MTVHCSFSWKDLNRGYGYSPSHKPAAQNKNQPRMWSQYIRQLSKRPLTTKAVTAASLMSLSDLACQSLEESAADKSDLRDIPTKCSHYDWKRTAHVGTTGLTFSGPISHAWYELLHKKLPPMAPSPVASTDSLRKRFIASRGPIVILGTKPFLDAVAFSPVAVAGYFVWRSMLEGKGFDGTVAKLQSHWGPALCSSWTFWPAVNVM